jgi:hypothetical protein
MELGKQIRTAAVSAALLAASLALPAKDVLPPSTGGVAPQSGPASPLTDKPSGLPTLVVAPSDLRIEDLSQGCHVFLYDRTHFDGTRLNIIGPVEMRTMEAPFGAPGSTSSKAPWSAPALGPSPTTIPTSGIGNW